MLLPGRVMAWAGRRWDPSEVDQSSHVQQAWGTEHTGHDRLYLRAHGVVVLTWEHCLRLSFLRFFPDHHSALCEKKALWIWMQLPH